MGVGSRGRTAGASSLTMSYWVPPTGKGEYLQYTATPDVDSRFKIALFACIIYAMTLVNTKNLV